MAYLYVVAPGRYRLLSSLQVHGSAPLVALLERLKQLDSPDPSLAPYEAEADYVTVAPMRLRPIKLALKGPPGPGWRMTLPRDLPPLGTAEVGQHLSLLFSQGYPELWSADRFNRGHESPFDDQQT
jgi:hypothetical protein